MKLEFKGFNDVRNFRGAPAARVLVADDGETSLMWMDKADIRRNIIEVGPHLALVQAAGRYGMPILDLAQAWRTNGAPKFLKRQDPVRDRDGSWVHPDWPETEDTALIERWADLIGFEINVSWLEQDLSDDAAEVRARWATGAGDFLAWEPKSPAGEGWFIAGISDHEDGPACVWVREKEDLKDAVPA